jgi:hypothetical protein
MYFTVMIQTTILPVKLIIPALFADRTLVAGVRELIEQTYGKLDLETAPVLWNHTEYYAAEMGPELYRVFFIPSGLIDRRLLPSIKNQTVDWESKYAVENKRRINIDPGYMSEGPFILASTKNYFHRIYLDQGVFAEVTLYYMHNEYHNLPWTYPDYATPEYKLILKKIREWYRKELEAVKGK